MNWYNYIACFFAGMFLANVVPHFVHGISGDRFPTPFAHPPGKGLSSPTVNVLWALLNLVVGYILFRVGKVSSGGNSALVIFFAGIVAISTNIERALCKETSGVTACPSCATGVPPVPEHGQDGRGTSLVAAPPHALQPLNRKEKTCLSPNSIPLLP